MSISINVVIIVITFIMGFTTKENGITLEYHGITGINWGNVNWLSTNGWTAFS
jgi:hypothetical protein